MMVFVVLLVALFAVCCSLAALMEAGAARREVTEQLVLLSGRQRAQAAPLPRQSIVLTERV